MSPLAAPEIRRARHEDWPAVRTLLGEIDDLHAALAPQYFKVADRDEREWWRLLADPTGMGLVAEPDAGQGPIGFLAIRVYDTPSEPTIVSRRRGHVETLVVARPHRRCGVGARLLGAATEWARGRGAVELVLTTWSGNTAADAFYERLGYRVLSRVLHTPL